MCLIPKIIPFACLLAQFGTPIVLDAKAERAFAPSASPVPPEPSPKGRHSNPIASGTQRAAPAAPFSRLNPNRPDSGLIPHIGAIPPGRFRLSPNVNPPRVSQNQPLYNHDPDRKLLDARRRSVTYP